MIIFRIVIQYNLHHQKSTDIWAFHCHEIKQGITLGCVYLSQELEITPKGYATSCQRKCMLSFGKRAMTISAKDANQYGNSEKLLRFLIYSTNVLRNLDIYNRLFWYPYNYETITNCYCIVISVQLCNISRVQNLHSHSIYNLLDIQMHLMV